MIQSIIYSLRYTFVIGFILSLARASVADTTEKTKITATDDLDLVKILNVKVSTATKTNESVDEAPAVITVVTRDDIRNWGYRSLAEVLTHTVGFFLVNDQILPNASVRGMTGGLGAESGAIKVMIDGRSVSYRTTSGNWLGVELIPLESVAQIEIIRGPASALYGADAFLGVINIITARPEDLPLVSARLSSGVSMGHPLGQFDIVGASQFGDFDLLLGAAGETADYSGLVLPPESPAPTLPSNLGARRTSYDLRRKSLVLQTRVGYRRPDQGHLILSAYGSGLRRGGDFAHWAQLTAGVDSNGRQTGTIVSLQQMRLNLDGQLKVSKSAQIALQSTYFQGGLLPSDRVEIASEMFYVERHQSYRGLDTTLEARYVPTAAFNVITGLETIYDRERFNAPTRVNRLTGENFVSLGATNRRLSLLNLGAFVSSSLLLFDPLLKLTGGIRYDRHSEYGDNLTGRLGLTSQMHRTIVAKALYGSAFKAPSPYLLYASPLRPGDVIGNSRLRPQYIHTLEYQMSYKPLRHFGLTTGVSYSWLLDKAEFTPQGLNLTARNTASQRSLAWESRLDIAYYDDFAFYSAFELVHAVRDSKKEGYAAGIVGTTNVVYPLFIARAGVRLSVPSTWSIPLQLAAQTVVVGPRRAFDTSLVEHGSNLVFPTYCLLDTSLSTREVYLLPGHETRFALRTRNLLDSKGPNPGFSGFEYPLEPSSIFIEASYSY
jgi:iron complex outermembrane receptor protein